MLARTKLGTRLGRRLVEAEGLTPHHCKGEVPGHGLHRQGGTAVQQLPKALEAQKTAATGHTAGPAHQQDSCTAQTAQMLAKQTGNNVELEGTTGIRSCVAHGCLELLVS